MQKSKARQTKAEDISDFVDYWLAHHYASSSTRYRIWMAMWYETVHLQNRVQVSPLQAISRVLSRWWRPVMPSRREETATHMRVKGQFMRKPLPDEADEVRTVVLTRGMVISGSVWSAEQPRVSDLYENPKKLSEAPVTEEHTEPERAWPEYPIGDFNQLAENARELQDSVGDASRTLYFIMEMETLLGRIEEKGRMTGRKYEARLAASLRDMCRVHDPSKLSQEQAQCLKGCVTALVEGWGKITREKLNYVRTQLLEKGLTWLPVTDKAMADLEEAQKQH
jgi:hypothetical protein